MNPTGLVNMQKHKSNNQKPELGYLANHFGLKHLIVFLVAPLVVSLFVLGAYLGPANLYEMYLPFEQMRIAILSLVVILRSVLGHYLLEESWKQMILWTLTEIFFLILLLIFYVKFFTQPVY